MQTSQKGSAGTVSNIEERQSDNLKQIVAITKRNDEPMKRDCNLRYYFGFLGGKQIIQIEESGL